MDKERVMRVVDPIFDLKGCAHADELLDRLEAAPELAPGEKRELRSLRDRHRYTRKEFSAVLDEHDGRGGRSTAGGRG